MSVGWSVEYVINVYVIIFRFVYSQSPLFPWVPKPIY